jgi:SRSO17 transposase
LVSRLRSDARLRETQPRPQPKNKRGRKPRHGPWLPRLSRLARQRSGFRTEKVAIYSKTVTLRLREVVAWWPPLSCAVKIVIARDPKRPKRVAYLMTTDLSLTAVEVVEAFAQRWTIEQMFSVAKNQVGFDSAEVRKERSVLRHAALAMAMITWVEVWTRMFRKSLSARPFAAKLAALREQTVMQTIFASGPRRKGSREIAGALATLFSAATRAA